MRCSGCRVRLAMHTHLRLICLRWSRNPEHVNDVIHRREAREQLANWQGLARGIHWTAINAHAIRWRAVIPKKYTKHKVKHLAQMCFFKKHITQWTKSR